MVDIALGNKISLETWFLCFLIEVRQAVPEKSRQCYVGMEQY